MAGGGKWLAQFLYDKGLRGDLLATAWALGMRESGGTNITSDSPNFNGADYGIWQFNQTHAANIKAKYGWTLDQVGADPEKAFTVFMDMSNKGKNMGPWGIPNPNGTVTGWALHVKQTQPGNWQTFNSRYKEYLADFHENYSGLASQGGGSNGDDSDPTGERRVLNDAARWARRQTRNPSENYSGICDHFVGAAYGLAHSGYEDANAHWSQTPGRLRHENDREPPPGALVFWEGGEHGHVAISMGNGMIATTDLIRPGKVDIVALRKVEQLWGNMSYRGWAAPYFGGKTYRMGTNGVQSGAQGATGSSAGDGSDNGEDLPTTDEGWAERFGMPLALLEEYPALKRLFDQAIEGEWDETRFEAALRGTNWYKKHRESWRQAELMKYEDPATYQASIKQAMRTLRSAAIEMGAAVTDADLNAMANKMVHQAWDEAQVNKFLAPFIKTYQFGGMRGAAGELEDRLRLQAYSNGIDMDQDFYLNAARRVAAGEATDEEWQDQITEKAASMFPMFKPQIMGGTSVRELVDPYVQSMARTLDLNPNEITLDNPTLRNALFRKKSDGTGWEPQSLADFEVQLRKDPRYQYTTQAMNTTTNLIDTLSRTFGFTR